MTLEQEQEAFDAQLAGLLAKHRGQVALFKDGRPVDFFAAHPEAYRAGLARFGLGAVFLVAPVEEARHAPISLAWQAGVMFGR